MYDPAIGRWMTPDPLAENHYNMTPYNYAVNNPILYVDLFGLDTIAPVTVTGYSPPKITPEIVAMLYEYQNTTKVKVEKKPSQIPREVADATSALGLMKESQAEMTKLSGLNLGSLDGLRFRVYGSNFYGNESVEIIHLAKAIEVGGYAITAIQVGTDIANIYLSGKNGVEKIAAERQLAKDIIMSGIYYYAPEAGILITVGTMIANSSEGQRAIHEAQDEIREKQGIWHLPQGPTYISNPSPQYMNITNQK